MAVAYSQLGAIVRGESRHGMDVIGERAYHTIKIANKIWLAQNLDLNFNGNLRYYNDDEATYGWNGLQYGALYNLTALTYLVNNIQTIAPGWRVPTELDFNTLIGAAGINGTGMNSGIHLASKVSFDVDYGDDLYGFNAKAVGYWVQDHDFTGLGQGTLMWTHKSTMFYIAASVTNAQVVSWATQKYNSIRLVRDA